MVIIQFIATNEFLEVSHSDITYVKQAADFADVTKANASYSRSFRIPRTPGNTKILENLGVTGDTSSLPYRRVYCRLLDNGVAIVEKGLLSVQETEREYKLHIQDGIIEFFQDVKDGKIGQEIELESLTHRATIVNVVESFSGQLGYKYIIADFGGPRKQPIEGVTNIDVTGLVPSLNVGWLLDRIFERYGWSYSGIDLYDLYMTYPNTTASDPESEFLILQATTTTGGGFTPSNFYPVWNEGYEVVDTDYAVFSDTQTIRIESGGRYRIEYDVNATYFIPREGTEQYVVNLVIDGELQPTGSTDRSGSIEVDLRAGSTIGFSLSYGQGQGRPGNPQMHHAGVSIYRLDAAEIDFRQALIDFKISDFFKEVMIRTATAPFVDVERRHIEFKTIEQRMGERVVDWSGKYVKRQKESYTFRNYAQNNYIRHKYDEDGEDFFDGNLQVENENLEIEKDLYQSQSYAPEREIITFNTTEGRIFTNRLKMWETEVSTVTDDDGNESVQVEYKGLKDRYFFIKEEFTDQSIYIENELIRGFSLVKLAGTTFNQIVSQRFSSARRILNNTRIHNIELALSKYDISTLDLSVRYFFRQQAAVYLLNRITWKLGENAVGEFIKINV